MPIKGCQTKREGMALGLVLLLILAGTAFVGVALYVVANLFSTSQSVTAEAKLYNAAQSGMEWGIEQLRAANDSNNIKLDSRTLTSGIEDIKAVKSDDIEIAFEHELDDSLADSSITVTVSILDCNYSYTGTLSNALKKDLPPQIHAASGSSTGGSGGEGTSAIIDPNRLPTFNSGGVTEHSYVIRSKATAWGKSKEFETMVVITR